MGRRSVWSDPEVIALTSKFVPAADEVWRLQRDDDPECRWFRRVVRGTAEPSRGTMQGTYVIAPGGKLLGSINTGSAAATREMLQRALAAWQELPDKDRKLANPTVVAPRFRWEDSYPKDGLVLARTARDLPRDHDPEAKKSTRYNRDAVWFSKAEARRWLPARLEVGTVAPVHRVIASRLAQVVFVDNVRGQTLPFHDDEVQDAAVTSEVTAIDGDRVHLRIKGETRAVVDGPWRFGDNYWKPKHNTPREVATWMLGRATFDRRQGRFVAFEAVALGVRRGYTQNNARGAKSRPGPIGFVLQLAPETWRVAPTFINVYDAGWVKRPG